MAESAESNSQAPDYVHTPFSRSNSIRLLSLEPGQFNDPLKITLREAPLDRLPNYEALSYVWGLPIPERPTLCHGARLLITKNCDAALRHLRQKRRTRLLWVDSICIDQKNKEEIEQQIALMGDVYSEAKRVVIWLGESTDLTDFFIDYLKDCHRIRTSRLWQPVRGFLLEPQDRSYKRKVEQLLRDGHRWDVLIGSILEREWFKRLWTVQEYVLSKDAVFNCGEKNFKSVELFPQVDILYGTVGSQYDPGSNYSENYRLKPQLPYNSFSMYFHNLRKYIQGGGNTGLANITEFLESARLQVATDPKDAVFGMFGILHKLQLEIDLPSYTQSVESIYGDITRAAIRHDNSLLILLASGSNRGYPNLPSWIPDWSIVPSHGLSFGKGYGDLGEFTTSKESECKYRFSPDGQLLYIHGILVDAVESVCRLHIPGDEDNLDPTRFHLACRKAFREMVSFAKAVPTYAAKQSWQEVLRWTLMKGRSLKYYNSHPDNDEEGDFAHLFSSLWTSIERDAVEARDDHVQASCSPSKENDQSTAVVWEAVGDETELAQDQRVSRCLLDRPTSLLCEEFSLENSAGLRLFRTSGGYLGKSLPDIQKDDVVLLIAGVTIPMIARPLGNTYRLVGLAYIHGIMKGEKWPEDEKELIEITLS